jgi:hypothetical protein
MTNWVWGQRIAKFGIGDMSPIPFSSFPDSQAPDQGPKDAPPQGRTVGVQNRFSEPVSPEGKQIDEKNETA